MIHPVRRTALRSEARALATTALALTLGALALAGGSSRLAAQTPGAPAPARVYFACYVPASGTTYRIKEPGLPAACLNTKGGSAHVEFSWTDGAAAVRTGDAAGGDLSGSYPAPTVAKLQGSAVAATAPTAGQLLQYDGAAWTPTPPGAAGPAGGELSGTYPNPTVAKLLGRPLPTETPGHRQLLAYDGGRSQWVAAPYPSTLGRSSGADVAEIGTASSRTLQVHCPNGAQMIGGGVKTVGGDTKVRESWGDTTGNYWSATVRNDHALNKAYMNVFVYCLSPSTPAFD